MPIIYKPKGRALEYAKLAANLYRGCIHGCQYCFAPSVLRISATEFHDPTKIKPRKDVLKHLQKDATKLRDQGCNDNVLLSFTTDSYQIMDEALLLTRRAIQILNSNDIGVTILTKGGKLAERDFDILSLDRRNQFGVTLTCLNELQSKEWEPGAAPPQERINSLKKAHGMGIYTYVSFEPVLEPVSVFLLIRDTADFVDFYKIGKLNYHPHSKTIDWPLFRGNVVGILHAYDKDFMLKKDLLEAR